MGMLFVLLLWGTAGVILAVAGAVVARSSVIFGGHNARNRTHVYIGTCKRCGGCAQKAQCISSPLKYLAVHVHEPARQRARDLVNTSTFVDAQGFIAEYLFEIHLFLTAVLTSTKFHGLTDPIYCKGSPLRLRPRSW